MLSAVKKRNSDHLTTNVVTYSSTYIILYMEWNTCSLDSWCKAYV